MSKITKVLLGDEWKLLMREMEELIEEGEKLRDPRLPQLRLIFEQVKEIVSEDCL